LDEIQLFKLLSEIIASLFFLHCHW